MSSFSIASQIHNLSFVIACKISVSNLLRAESILDWMPRLLCLQYKEMWTDVLHLRRGCQSRHFHHCGCIQAILPHGANDLPLRRGRV